MPRHLGKLKKLQTLTKFIVGKHSGSGIGELKKLTNLRCRGSLSITNLQNVTSPTDADLNLVDKKYLEELELRWNRRYPEGLLLKWNCWEGNTEDTSEREIVVLKSLQPHSNLKSLTIEGYRGKSFPDWVGHPSFSNLSSLRLSDCWECCSSLPLGQLLSLEKLDLRNCPQVESFTEGGLPSNLNEITIIRCDKLFANRMGWGLQKLQCLRRFTFRTKLTLWSPFQMRGCFLPVLPIFTSKAFKN
jgi:Leucine-rich repeat (LRR) protein